jgi:single-strand DNA-binding protein
MLRRTAMSQIGYVTLTGYVTTEPKLRSTRKQVPVTHVRVGSTPRRIDRDTGEWRDGDTSYYNVNCWRRLAVNVSASLRKGDPVIIRGKFRTRTWLDEGRPRIEVEIDADSIGHDMSLGWAHFNRGVHPPTGASQGLGEGEAARSDAIPEPDGAEFPGDFGEDEELTDGVVSDEGGDPGAGMAAAVPDHPLAEAAPH